MNTNCFYFMLFLCVAAVYSQSRIKNGNNIAISQANYYVLVMCNGRGGGTLVRRNKVVTAAHCVDETCTVSQFQIAVGLNFYSDLAEAKKYRAKAIRIHPKYVKKVEGGSSSPYDIAVVTLTENVELNNNVGLINYAVNIPPIGAYVTVVGYGSINLDLDKPERLQRTQLRVEERQGTQFLTEIQGSSVMKGDSGGPAVYNDRLTGVISAMRINANNVITTNIFIAVGHPEILNFIQTYAP